MTALVPETLDATAGRARRTGLWSGAAWRWSLLAGLGLHGALIGAWWVGAQRAEPVLPPVPMQVRLAELAAPPRSAPHRGPHARDTPQTLAAQTVSPNGAMPARPDSPPNSPRKLPSMALAPPSVQSLATRAMPSAPQSPPPAVTPAATVPVTSTAPPAAPPSPSATTSPPGPAPTQASTAPTTATPGAHASAVDATEGADRNAPPTDMPSSSVAYLVKPVLTFPPGSEDMGESGSVTLRVLVDDKGVVSTVQRLKSSGYVRLDQHAASVIRRARFRPHLVNGVPRAAWATVTLNFNPS